MAEAVQKLSVEELERKFLKDIYRLPGGEKIKVCIQCGRDAYIPVYHAPPAAPTSGTP